MAVRSIVVRLRAEVSDFNAQMAQAATAAQRVGAQFDKNGQKIQTEMGRMVRSAQINREAWTTVGTTLGAVGTAIAAVGAAALKTGIAYNTLQQTSRAALKTLLGGAEAANAQMDKLDEFARTSPFAKDVFIRAQQQMLGFGIEAKKVIPYLDAAQNAVAAFGGSNHDLSEVVRIMSQISASSKITATDLREFGNRGIDAATLIGSQMNMTGAEIREAITAGTIDAQAALDALAAGMQERFGGAADGVKDTFEGAMDRVKAAWRDLASELAEPLVDPDGGGALIGLFNATADAARHFQALPGPIKAATVAIAALTSASALASSAFFLLGPRLIDIRAASVALGKDMPRTTAAMRGLGRGVGIATAALAIFTAEYELFSRMGDGFVARVDKITEGLSELDDQGVDNVVRSLRELDAELSKNVLDERLAYGPLGAVNRIRNLGNDKGLISARDAIADINTASANTTINLTRLAEETGRSYDELKQLAEMNGVDLSDAMGSDSARIARERVVELTKAVIEAETAATEWQLAVRASNADFIVLTDAYDAAIEANIAWAQSVADSTTTADDSWQDYYDGQSVSADEYIAQLQAQVDAQTQWEANMVSLTERTRRGMGGEMRAAATEMIDELLELGPAGAEQVALLNSMTNEEFTKVVELWRQKGEAAVTEFTDEIESARQPVLTPNIDFGPASTDYDAWVAARRKITITASMVAPGYGNVAAHVDTIRRAAGGPVFGPGTGTSDSIPAWLSNGEHVWTAREVAAAGGHAAMEEMRRAVVYGYAAKGFAGGGPVYTTASNPMRERMVAASGSTWEVVNNISVQSTPEATAAAVVRRLQMMEA